MQVKARQGHSSLRLRTGGKPLWITYRKPCTTNAFFPDATDYPRSAPLNPGFSARAISLSRAVAIRGNFLVISAFARYYTPDILTHPFDLRRFLFFYRFTAMSVASRTECRITLGITPDPRNPPPSSTISFFP
jgi:hypothetical protein